MALSRKQALKRLRGLVKQVESHLDVIASAPGEQALHHHQHEARIWLSEMEEVLRHVGKKTSSEWEARIATFRAALEE